MYFFNSLEVTQCKELKFQLNIFFKKIFLTVSVGKSPYVFSEAGFELWLQISHHSSLTEDVIGDRTLFHPLQKASMIFSFLSREVGRIESPSEKS